MANKRLTENGKNFIRRVATYFNGQKGGSRSLIEGNNGKMVNSNSPSDKIWVANVINKYTNKVISNNNELAEYLIQLYDEYSAQYAVDANVIAAQGFQESEFRVWVYNNVNSTASGIPQILMKTVYDIIYTYKWLSTDEKNALIKDMEYPERKTSWIDVVGDNEQTAADKERQTRNHPILHQNMIDNLHIIVKMQCRLMDFIAKRNNNLAASALFAYNRGSSLTSDNYIELVNKRAKDKGNDLVTEGVNYVEAIFRYLGDQNHDKVKNTVVKLRTYVKGFWFGYKQIDFGFDSFNSNANSSSNVDGTSRDISLLREDLKAAYLKAKQTFDTNNIGNYSIGVSEVYRTPQKQYEYYQKGRNSRGEVVNKNAIITYIDGYNKIGKHNYNNSLAFDFYVYNEQTKSIDWENTTKFREFANLVLTELPSADWGGNWESFRDLPHIEV